MFKKLERWFRRKVLNPTKADLRSELKRAIEKADPGFILDEFAKTLGEKIKDPTQRADFYYFLARLSPNWKDANLRTELCRIVDMVLA